MQYYLLILAWITAMISIFIALIDTKAENAPWPINLFVSVKTPCKTRKIWKIRLLSLTALVTTLTLILSFVAERQSSNFLGRIALEGVLSKHRELQSNRIRDRIGAAMTPYAHMISKLNEDEIRTFISSNIDKLMELSKDGVEKVEYIDILREFDAPSTGKVFWLLPQKHENAKSDLLDWFETWEDGPNGEPDARIWKIYTEILVEKLPHIITTTISQAQSGREAEALEHALPSMVATITDALHERHDKPILAYYHCLTSLRIGCKAPPVHDHSTSDGTNSSG